MVVFDMVTDFCQFFTIPNCSINLDESAHHEISLSWIFWSVDVSYFNWNREGSADLLSRLLVNRSLLIRG